MTTAAANFPLAWRTRGAIRVLMSVNPVSKKKARNVSSAALAETVRSNMRKPKQNKSTKETRQFILNLILGGEVIVTQNQQVSSGIANGTIANVMDVVISDEDHVQWHEEPNFGGGYHSIEAKYVGGLLLRHAAGEWAGQSTFPSFPVGCFPLMAKSNQANVTLDAATKESLKVSKIQFECNPSYALTAHKL